MVLLVPYFWDTNLEIIKLEKSITVDLDLFEVKEIKEIE